MRLPRMLTRSPLGAILVFALFVRVVFFVGLVSGDPQDDGIYYLNAYALYEQGVTSVRRYAHLPPGFLANPIDQFYFRPMVTWPIAGTFAVSGPGEVSATLWPFLCSMLSVVVVYRLGRVLHDRTVGLLAASLCAFYPLEVINGTRILSDVPVEMFCSLALLLFVEGTCRGRDLKRHARWFVLSGASVGCAYLGNARGLIFLGALLVVALLFAFRRKVRWSALLWVLAGFAGVFSVEAIAYVVITGDPLLSYHIQSGASYFKYLHEPVGTAKYAWLEIKYTNGVPLQLTRSVLLLDAGPVRQFGWFFYLFLAAGLFVLVRRRHLGLLALSVALFLYLDYGPLFLHVDWNRRVLEYMMVFKQDRYLLIITAPLLVISAYFVRSIARWSLVVAGLLVVALLITSFIAIRDTRAAYRAGLTDLRTLAPFVESQPDRLFYGDLWAVQHLRIFTRHQAHNLRVLDGRAQPGQVKGACVVLGGARGVELVADYVESTLPPFARDVLRTGAAPPGWALAMEVTGPRTAHRHADLRMYCVQ